MTGKEKLHAALSGDGSREVPAVICYEGIYIRDRWTELSSRPWWYREAPDLDRQLAWRREVLGQLGQDWFHLPGIAPAGERRDWWIDQRGETIYCVNRHTGEEEELCEPPVGGWPPGGGLQSAHPESMPDTQEELDALIPPPDPEWVNPHQDGRGDLATPMLAEYGDTLLAWSAVASPLWDCYDLWGFEGLMTRVADQPALVAYACQRHVDRALPAIRTAAALGAEAIWIEECFTDLLSPDDFRRLNLPVVRQLVEAIREAGMFSVYYYCGDPRDRWDALLDAGADALALEESKKGFTIDIEEVVDRAAGRCTVFGNLDSVGVLQDGSDEALRAEVERQLAAGRRTGGRFVMSVGSPVTPGTPVARVRRYCDLVRELGAR